MLDKSWKLTMKNYRGICSTSTLAAAIVTGREKSNHHAGMFGVRVGFTSLSF
jgi:hypothetical protein